MATELGKAYVQIMPSAKGISGSISSVLNPEVNSASNSAGTLLGSNLVKKITGIITAAGIGKVFTDTLIEGAKLQQSLGGVETLFKASADKVKGYADIAYETTGLSANAYMENVTGFSASLLQSLAGDTEKAAEIANMAMIDMSDNSNKMGTSMESIQNAYQGFAKQNYTMLDNLKLGYGGTKTEMERLLKDAQKLTGVKYDINNLSDVYSAIHEIQKEMDITGTTAKESASTFSGSLASMKSATSNLLGKLSLGQDITKEMQTLVKTTGTFLFKNLLPMIGNILKGIPSIFTSVFRTITPNVLQSGVQLMQQLANGFLTSIPNLLSAFNQITTSIMQFITANLPGFLNTGVSMIISLCNGFLAQVPAIIQTASQLLNSFVSFLMENIPVILSAGVDMIFGLVDGLISNFPAIVSATINLISSFISTLASGYPQYIAAGFEVLGKFLSGLLDRIPAVLTTIGGLANDIIKSITGIDLFAAGKAIIDGFLGGLKAAWDGVTGFIGGIASWIAKNKGPISYDRKLLIPAGKAIMAGLNQGLVDNFANVKQTVEQIAGSIYDSINTDIDIRPSLNLQDKLTQTLDTMRINDNQFSNVAMNIDNYPETIETTIVFKEKEIMNIVTPIVTKKQKADAVLSSVVRGERYV